MEQSNGRCIGAGVTRIFFEVGKERRIGWWQRRDTSYREARALRKLEKSNDKLLDSAPGTHLKK